MLHGRRARRASASSGATREGTNDFGKRGYLGPNPAQSKRHRYAFRIYALDVCLDLSPDATRVELDISMDGHVLAGCYADRMVPTLMRHTYCSLLGHDR